MKTSPDHDKICEKCLSVAGCVHSCDPVYDAVKKEWSMLGFELVACPMWNRNKAVHRWGKYRRRFPYVTGKSSVPLKCRYSLEHFFLEE